MHSLRLGSRMHMPMGLAVDLGDEGEVGVDDEREVLGHLRHLVGSGGTKPHLPSQASL
jgi:hypothetical protein